MKYLVIKNQGLVQESKRNLNHKVPQKSLYCITDQDGRVYMHVEDNLDNPLAFAMDVVKVLNNAEKEKKGIETSKEQSKVKDYQRGTCHTGPR